MDNPSAVVRTRLSRRIARLLRNLFAVIGVIAVVYLSGFDLAVMVSDSMAPTLQGNGGAKADRVLFERVSCWFRRPRRWEVVQVVNADQLVVAKRVVGLPGERVSLVDHQVVVDGKAVQRPASLSFLRLFPYGNLRGEQPVDCGAGYFLLGDDSKDSWDSRYEGPFPPDRLRGRAWLIVWPPSRIGFVNP